MTINDTKNLGTGKLALLSTTAMFFALCAPLGYAQSSDTSTSATTETSAEEDLELEGVTVTGIRGALRTARDLKRDSDTFVDSITASDVSQLPDLSVAEALARVPGVVTQRFDLGNNDGGDFPSPEGTGNIVRGLSYVRSEFNGRDAFSANGGRALEWASIPPELIGAVEISKNQTADMIEGGIAGTVNLRTLEPFDRDGVVAVVSLEGVYTDLAEEISPGGSVVLGNRWNTNSGEFGLLGSYSNSNLKSELNGFQIAQVLPIRLDPNADLSENSEYVAVPGGFQARDQQIERQRDSYYLAGQWRSPDGDLEVTAKYIRVENEVSSDERTVEYFTDGENWFQTQLTGAAGDYTTRPFTSDGLPVCNGNNEGANPIGSCEVTRSVQNGLYEAGVVSNSFRDWTGANNNVGAPFSGLAADNVTTSMTQDISANVKWRANDQLYVELDAHVTQAESALTELWGGTRFFSDYAYNFADIENPTVTLIEEPDGALNPAFNRGSVSDSTGTNDPDNSFFLFAADRFYDNDGDLYALRGDVEYEFDNDGWFDAVKFGARFSEREQTNREAGRNWAGIAPSWGGGRLSFEDSNIASEVFDYSDFQRGGVFLGDNTSFVFPDRGLLDNYDAFVAAVGGDALIGSRAASADAGDVAPQEGELVFGNGWRPLRYNGSVDYANRGAVSTVKERTTNLSARLDFGNEFDNGTSLEGNFGLRYVDSETTGVGTLNYIEFVNDDTPVDNPGTYNPELAAYLAQPDETISLSAGYEYVLPSFNVKWNLTDEMLVRFAASQSITPPNIADLNANQVQVPLLNYIVDEAQTPPVVTNIIPTEIRVYGGNPDLKPIEATNLDLSFEYYFGDDGQFTVSAFHKDIENIIVYGTENRGTITANGVTLPVVYAGNLNLNDGSVSGYEIGYQQFFTELPGLFSNFGIQANYTAIQSKSSELPAFVDADGDGNADDFLRTYRWNVSRLLGLSDTSYNLIGLYQSDKLELRLAYNWRSEYLSSYRDFITGNPITQSDVGFLDASARYDLTDNFQVRIQAANILDTKSVATQQIDASGATFGRSSFVGDRRIEVGVSYTY